MIGFKQNIFDMRVPMGDANATPQVQEHGEDKITFYHGINGKPTDVCRMRPPSFSYETRLIVAHSLIEFGTTEIIGQPRNLYDPDIFENHETIPDPKSPVYGLKFVREGEDIIAIGTRDYADEVKEIRRHYGWLSLIEPFEMGRQRLTSVIDTDAFIWFSERLWHLAKFNEKKAGFWGTNPNHAWYEKECPNWSEGDVLEKYDALIAEHGAG